MTKKVNPQDKKVNPQPVENISIKNEITTSPTPAILKLILSITYLENYYL